MRIIILNENLDKVFESDCPNEARKWVIEQKYGTILHVYDALYCDFQAPWEFLDGR
jgi:hypothetical protein